MADIPKLKIELLAGHPDAGAYDVDSEVAAGQLNAVNRSIHRTSCGSSDKIRTSGRRACVAGIDRHITSVVALAKAELITLAPTLAEIRTAILSP